MAGSPLGLVLIVGWSFIATGLYAWWRRPDNRTGALMAAVGFAWLATGLLSRANDDALFTAGIALDALFAAIIGHLVLAFPEGRLHSRGERLVVGATYFLVTVLQVPSLLFEDDPRNQLVIEADQQLSDRLDVLQYIAAITAIVASLVILSRRWRASTPPMRRALAPVAWTGSAVTVVYLFAKGFDAAGSRQIGLERLSQGLLALVPFGFLAGLLRSRLTQATAVSDLVARLGHAPDPETLRSALATALGDPSLKLAYWLEDGERFVDAAGRPFAVPAGSWSEVELNDRRIAALVHDPSLSDERQLLRAAGAAAALALDNQRLSAALRARIEELRASRARLLTAADAERRRLERDLHDGAQARLVSLAMKLGRARVQAEGQPELAALLDASWSELQAGIDELRELARGIHPSVLTDHGLARAIATLADRVPVAATVDGTPPDDLPAPVQQTIYFVVAEALTNVAKHARAQRAVVTVQRGPGCVVLEIADDGAGGAHVGAGSGLSGLADRVAALDGRLAVDSPPGGGTRVRVEIPVA